MVEYIKTDKGYFYKITGGGIKTRISKNEYMNKHRNSKKETIKGGSNIIKNIKNIKNENKNLSFRFIPNPKPIFYDSIPRELKNLLDGFFKESLHSNFNKTQFYHINQKKKITIENINGKTYYFIFKDKISSEHHGYGFTIFVSEDGENFYNYFEIIF